MSKSINLSPKHGVNPTIPLCFFCGKEKNEVALLGKLKNDTAAPMYCLLDYNPCDDCQKLMDKGITLIEATDTPNTENQLEIAPGVYPTGKWHVVSENFIKNNISKDMQDSILKHRKSFIQPGIMPEPTDE